MAARDHKDSIRFADPASDPIDDITTFLGPLDDNEYALRAQMRDCRNRATFLAMTVRSPSARRLLWMAGDVVTGHIYSQLDLQTLEDVTLLCTNLLVVAEQFERLHFARKGKGTDHA